MRRRIASGRDGTSDCCARNWSILRTASGCRRTPINSSVASGLCFRVFTLSRVDAFNGSEITQANWLAKAAGGRIHSDAAAKLPCRNPFTRPAKLCPLTPRPGLAATALGGGFSATHAAENGIECRNVIASIGNVDARDIFPSVFTGSAFTNYAITFPQIINLR